MKNDDVVKQDLSDTNGNDIGLSVGVADADLVRRTSKVQSHLTFGNIGPSAATTHRMLSLRQQLFLKFYLEHGCGARAAREAGYRPPHNIAAAKILQSKKVHHAMQESLHSIGMTRELLVHILNQMLQYSMANFISVDEDTRCAKVDLQQGLAAGAGCIIKQVFIGKDGRAGLTLHDPIRIIERLARLSGWIDGAGRRRHDS
jgi:hypothetical protein